VYHHTIQINHQLDTTISPVYYPDVYLQLNMFRAFSRPSSGAQQLQEQSQVLPSEGGDSSADGRGRADRPDHDHLVGDLFELHWFIISTGVRLN
jgi:hypothetical protein